MHWIVGRALPANIGTALSQMMLGDVVGHMVLESCPEDFGESEIAELRSALVVVDAMNKMTAALSQASRQAANPEETTHCHRLCARSSDLIILCDEAGCILRCSHPFAQLMNLHDDAVLGQRLRDLLLDRGNQELLATAADDVRTTGHLVRGDFEFKTAKGPVLMDCILSSITDDAGHIVAVLISGRDVTESRHREQLLERRITEAEDASRARDEFLSLLGHELRTPLTPIATGIEALKQSLPTAASPGDLSIIEQNVQAEARMIDDLLDLARISRGGLSLRLDTIDAQQIIDEAVAACRPDLAARHLDLHIEPGATQTLVRADAGRLKQVFWHLLNNASKFTPIGGRITITTSNDSSLSDSVPTFVCQVTDTGLGIDRARLCSWTPLFAFWEKLFA
jgi:PAS domain S-box-containing protein